ncbi:hypothetical protein OESDEN_09627 [Oesophagostomum dentatum]|uniref:Uncharacterized protein n=1 Tax=Oesophagostomum dentatum TaxID=61180 RepID=A0A0B1SYZ4_OESDE|nr:hypothetical protein OESDEN_09627 [Oesophagostomum dentatum]
MWTRSATNPLAALGVGYSSVTVYTMGECFSICFSLDVQQIRQKGLWQISI